MQHYYFQKISQMEGKIQEHKWGEGCTLYFSIRQRSRVRQL